MKEIKMGKKKLKNGNSYLIYCVCSILMILTFCYFGINYTVKGTRAGFGCFSGCLAPYIDVIYLPNYPEGTLEAESMGDSNCGYHVVYTNGFAVPDGYEFIGWNTSSDGTGSEYVVDITLCLEEDLTLYAQWAKINNEEVSGDSGDGTNDGDNIQGEDGEIVEPDDDTDSSDDVSDNEDESGTGSEDGSETDIDDNSGENSDGNLSVDNGDNDNTGTGSGTGDGSETGTETDTDKNAGNNAGQNSSDKPSSKPNNNSGNKVDSSVNQKPQTNNNSSVVEKKYYKFKFMYEDNEYASSSCEVLTDGTCLMLLPGVNPNKDGYVFSGWSLNKDCPSGEIITKSISVKGNNTYYACFIKRADNTKVNFVTVGITVFVIWVVALTMIYVLVKWFKKKENNN